MCVGYVAADRKSKKEIRTMHAKKTLQQLGILVFSICVQPLSTKYMCNYKIVHAQYYNF